MDRSMPYHRQSLSIHPHSNRERLSRRVAGEPDQAAAPEQAAQELNQLKQLAWLMDESIPIPMTGMKVGIDGLLGLIPGVGDLLSAGIGSYIVARANKLGVPRIVLARMAGNVVIDAAVGAIPLVGDLFDFAWKANRRNLQLLVDHLESPQATKRSSRWFAVGLIGLIIAAFVGIAAIMGAIFAALFA